MTRITSQGWGPPAVAATLAILLQLGLDAAPAAAREESGLVASPAGPALAVRAPKGWTVDERGTTDGIPLVVVPEDGTWEDSPAVMYVRTFARTGKLSLERFVRDDVARLRAESPRCRVREGEAIKIEGGARALVREFSRDRWGNRENVAYLAAPEGYVTVVLSARDTASHAAARDAFHDLVGRLRLLKQGDDLFAVATALRAAERNSGTPKGRSFEARIGEQLRQASVVRECANDRPDPDGNQFSLLLRIAGDGSVAEVLAHPEGGAADCVRKSLVAARFAPPPRADYWVRAVVGVPGTTLPAQAGTASRTRPD